MLGVWILDLLTLPTKFITKRLKELKSVLQNSFHHAPCLKFTTKGPLTLKDLQQLTPSASELTPPRRGRGCDYPCLFLQLLLVTSVCLCLSSQLWWAMIMSGSQCLPLLFHPGSVKQRGVAWEVGYFMPPSFLQDKLLLEPYAMRKSIAYLVIIPSSISNGPSLTPPLKKYFRDLSLVYKVCQCHGLSLGCIDHTHCLSAELSPGAAPPLGEGGW